MSLRNRVLGKGMLSVVDVDIRTANADFHNFNQDLALTGLRRFHLAKFNFPGSVITCCSITDSSCFPNYFYMSLKHGRRQNAGALELIFVAEPVSSGAPGFRSEPGQLLVCQMYLAESIDPAAAGRQLDQMPCPGSAFPAKPGKEKSDIAALFPIHLHAEHRAAVFSCRKLIFAPPLSPPPAGR